MSEKTAKCLRCMEREFVVEIKIPKKEKAI